MCFFFPFQCLMYVCSFWKNKKYRNTNHKAGGVCVCTKQWVRVVADGRAKTQTQSGKTTGRHTKDQKKNTNLNRNQIIIQKFRQIKTLKKKKEIFFFVFYSPFCFGDVFFVFFFVWKEEHLPRDDQASRRLCNTRTHHSRTEWEEEI